jgi:hypothetical protein
MILCNFRAVDLIPALRGLADQAVFSDRTVKPGIEYIQLRKKCKKKSVRGPNGDIVHGMGVVFLPPFLSLLFISPRQMLKVATYLIVLSFMFREKTIY